MVVWLKPCESRSSPGFIPKTPLLTQRGFSLCVFPASIVFLSRHSPGVASACPCLGRAEPCSAAFPTPVHDPHRYGAEHGSALPDRRECVHLRCDAWRAPLPVSVPRVPASVEPSHARLLSRNRCMIPTATVPSMARHYLGCEECVHLRCDAWRAPLPASVPRAPTSVEPSHARLLSQHLCMSPTATVPSMARHYWAARNAFT